MKTFFQTKKAGFYFSFVACLLTLVSLILYTRANNQVSTVFVLLGIVLAVEVVCLALSFKGFRPWMNLSMTVCAVLMAVAVVLAVSTQLDALGYAMAGLYTIDQVMPYLQFAVVSAVALVIFLISSFMDYGKNN